MGTASKDTKYVNALTRRLRSSAFQDRPVLFYGTILFLLALLCIAAVHELIPGLCEAGDEGEENCPFCQLVHVLVMAAAAIALLHYGARISAVPLPDNAPRPCRVRFPAYRLRAPPLA